MIRGERPHSYWQRFFEVRPSDARRDDRLVINLKGIGTLLDVNGSLDRISEGV